MEGQKVTAAVDKQWNPKAGKSTTNLSRQGSRATLIPTHHHFSAQANKKSNSDDALLSLIESVIDWEERYYKVGEAPREFPFKIKDNAGEEFITLTRDYQGEVIGASACWPKDPKCYFHLCVSVMKKSGPTLVFDARADETDEISIDSITVENPNASNDYITFSDLDEKLQDAFHTYLDVRGFNPAITNSYGTTWFGKTAKNTLG
ncbi:hypothetical protein C5167_000834, partial [Papaver somniferum]